MHEPHVKFHYWPYIQKSAQMASPSLLCVGVGVGSFLDQCLTEPIDTFLLRSVLAIADTENSQLRTCSSSKTRACCVSRLFLPAVEKS